MSNFALLEESYLSAIESQLKKSLDDVNYPEQTVVDSVKYSLLNPGKRTRALFTIGFCKLFGGEMNDALALACAVEMIHCYSLIHDDLPCMDDDDFRRGQPSNHKMFGEATALLAGDALLTGAFEVITRSRLSDSIKVKAIEVLSTCAGYKGMIGGQTIDLQSEEKQITLEELKHMHALKTGALFQASCVLGVLAATTKQEALDLGEKFSQKVGLAFQIVDDILDVEGTQEELGKPIGSDKEKNKSTFVTLLGLEESKKESERLSEEATGLLEENIEQSEHRDFLITLANKLLVRRK